MPTAKQIKSRILASGKTIAEVAREKKISPYTAYRVLNGYDKGKHGAAFRAAQALGITKREPDAANDTASAG